MLLAELAQGIGTVENPARGSIMVRDITDDSRQVRPGSLFIARKGLIADGRTFIAQAIEAGACAVMCKERLDQIPPNIPMLVVEDAALAMAQLAERFFGNPTSSLKLAGVTGTNGKSTIVHLIHQALERMNTRCGLVGTIETHDGLSRARATLTTPPATELSRLFASMLANGCEAAAMEVSSHALHQRRVAGLSFDIGVFTNLSGDHLDYHVDMDSYAEAKAMLFEQLPSDGLAIIHATGARAEQMAARCACPVLMCGGGSGGGSGEGGECDVRIEHESFEGQRLTLIGPWGEVRVRTQLIGGFNAMNTLQAAAAVHAITDCDSDQLACAFEGLAGPTGRLDPVHRPGDGLRVLVDFAHTDDALRNSIGAVRGVLEAEKSGGQLWVIFGAGGDRDGTKRPRMGRVVGELADRVVVTSDNPRSEPPRDIIDQIVAGIPEAKRSSVIVEPDRTRAIELALTKAQAGDVVLIAGKGHERDQLIAGGTSGGYRAIEHDDALCARRVLDNLAAKTSRSAHT